MKNKSKIILLVLASIFTFTFIFHLSTVSADQELWDHFKIHKLPKNHKHCGKEKHPKYVFFFIGDGMASVQIHAAEVYIAQLIEEDSVAGETKAEKLAMSHFPVQGMATTYANNRFITDSAAAGTALACGMKTNCGVISMDPFGVNSYASIAELAHDKGMKVGIISSVSIDHATPAVFYAHQKSRNYYNAISYDLVNSDFEYFAGGGFKKPLAGTTPGDTSYDIFTEAAANGYTVVTTRPELESLHRVPGQKIIAYNHTLDNDKALYYELDRPEDHISLAEFTRKGIELLYNRKNGFFMMIEGGKIDWACHANDARAAIDDTIAFDDAIKEALFFYSLFPNETLIVVTGDHECGGMTLGFAGMYYETAFEVMEEQEKSYIEFGNDLNDYYTSVGGKPSAPADIDATLKGMIEDTFGLVYSSLTTYEQDMLEEAYDWSKTHDNGFSYGANPQEFLDYGNYEPLTVTCTHVLNRQAGIGFTSYYHTGVPVPVLAIGKCSDIFDGFYDNTDIAKKIADCMNVNLNN